MACGNERGALGSVRASHMLPSMSRRATYDPDIVINVFAGIKRDPPEQGDPEVEVVPIWCEGN
jgi:hypothetical protein